MKPIEWRHDVRVLILGIIILLNFILESTVFQYTRIFGVKPDFTIMLIVSYAIMRGSIYGGSIGLVSGFLNDLFYGKSFGVNSLSYMLTGYIIGQSQENIFKDSLIPSVFFNIVGIFIYQNLFYFISYLSKVDISYMYVLINIIVPQSIYNGILGVIVYRYIYILDEKSFMDKKIY